MVGERRFFFKDENRGSSGVPSTAVRGAYLVHPDRGSVVHLLIPPGLLVSQEFGLDWGPLPVHIAREPLHVSDDVVLPELLQLPDAPAPRDGRRDERDEKRGSRPTPPRDAVVRPPIATVHRGDRSPGFRATTAPPESAGGVGVGAPKSTTDRNGLPGRFEIAMCYFWTSLLDDTPRPARARPGWGVGWRVHPGRAPRKDRHRSRPRSRPNPAIEGLGEGRRRSTRMALPRKTRPQRERVDAMWSTSSP